MKERGFAILTILVAGVVVIVVSGVILTIIKMKDNSPFEKAQDASADKSKMPAITAYSSPSASPKKEEIQTPQKKILINPAEQLVAYPYKALKEVSEGEELSLFRDDLLHVQFSFPKKYSIYSVKADEKDKSASVFFLADPKSKSREDVDYEVECEISNRKDPSGICSEGVVSDLDLRISINKEVTEPYESQKTGGMICEEEVNSSDRKIYSCRTMVSVGGFGYQYSIYLYPKKNPITVKLSTYEASRSADLIKSIIDSVAITN